MAEIASLFVRVTADTEKATNDLKNFGAKLKDIGKQMQIAGTIMTVGLTLPIVTAGKAMFGMAADFEESINKVDVAFGDSADGVKQWAKTTIQQFGIAEGTALDMASLFGDMSTAMGLSTTEASDMSKGLVGLAGDLASFKNVQLDVAKTALAGVFTGETESLKRLGIVMTEANLEQYALSKGIQKSIKDMTQAEKVQLRYAYVTEMSANAVGDFARTSDSSANVVRTYEESLKELSVAFGQELLPLLTPIIEGLTNVVKWFGSLDSTTKTIIIAIAGVIAIIGPLLVIFGTVISTIGTMVAVFGAAAGAVALTMGGVVVAIAAVITAGVYLWKNWDTVKEKASDLWDKIKDVFDKIKNIDVLKIGRDLLDGLWKGVMEKWEAFKQSLADIAKAIADAFSGKSISNVNPYTSMNTGTTGVSQAPSTNIGSTVVQNLTINAPTALNPQQVARTTSQSLRNFALGYQ